jgi:inactivated superfamily I helicase
LLEARLQHADLMILGGLNEGVWPAMPSPDPWLAPRIRAELGLPGLERRIGLSAHDSAMALGAPQVIVTRARRDARAPDDSLALLVAARGDDRRADPRASAEELGGVRSTGRRAIVRRTGRHRRRRSPIGRGCWR